MLINCCQYFFLTISDDPIDVTIQDTGVVSLSDILKHIPGVLLSDIDGQTSNREATSGEHNTANNTAALPGDDSQSDSSDSQSDEASGDGSGDW